MTMNKSDTAKLLGLIVAYDRRTIGEADVEAWHAAIEAGLGEHVRFEDCRAAVIAHYTEDRRWLMPADVVGFVKTLRKARRRHIPMPPAPRGLTDGSGYPIQDNLQTWRAFQQWREDTLRQIENGEHVPDPPLNVVRKAMRDVEDGALVPWIDNAGQALSTVIEGVWPTADEPPAIDDGRTKRDMSFVDEIADAKAI